MNLTGLHLLLTYQCNYECEHCFVWGSPSQSGTMTLVQVREIYRQAQALGTVEMIYLEGGEPFLYYPIMCRAAQEAVEMGFGVGIVTNNYWATSVEDAIEWLRPLAGVLQNLSISTDLFHAEKMMSQSARNAQVAAEQLGISTSTLICESPTASVKENGDALQGDVVMYKGRAAVKLAQDVEARHPWHIFNECPYETLDDPGRVHVDCEGNLHLCQGITMGSLFQRSLVELTSSYEPAAHPIVGPLLAGGPAALVQCYDLPHETAYVDACHLCYTAREALRERFPAYLRPGQVYGEGL